MILKWCPNRYLLQFWDSFIGDDLTILENELKYDPSQNTDKTFIKV